MKYLLVILVISALLLAYTSPVAAQSAEREAELAIAQAEEVLLSMEWAGFSTLFSKDAVSDAKEAFDGGDYAEAMEKSSTVISRSERAFEIGDSLGALDLKIQDLETRQLEVSRAREMLSAAVVAFDKENYDEAEEFIFQGNNELDDAEAEYSILSARYTAARGNLLAYLRDHVLKVIASLILLGLIILGLYIITSRAMINKKIRSMELEKDVLKKLMEKAQVQYYRKASVSKSAFEIKNKVYRERTIQIEEELPVLHARLARLENILPIRLGTSF
ncbi:MAG: hypothetical protein V3V92_03935 [Candidatus Hydrothermarchaeales archaeon]